jgi:hypothetical protein
MPGKTKNAKFNMHADVLDISLPTNQGCPMNRKVRLLLQTKDKNVIPDAQSAIPLEIPRTDSNL